MKLSRPLLHDAEQDEQRRQGEPDHDDDGDEHAQAALARTRAADGRRPAEGLRGAPHPVLQVQPERGERDQVDEDDPPQLEARRRRAGRGCSPIVASLTPELKLTLWVVNWMRWKTRKAIRATPPQRMAWWTARRRRRRDGPHSGCYGHRSPCSTGRTRSRRARQRSRISTTRNDPEETLVRQDRLSERPQVVGVRSRMPPAHRRP